MIIEGLITCVVTDQSPPHVAALGPVVDQALTHWTLRPFQSSKIFSLLRQHSRCVFHTLDDALPVVQLVLGLTPDLSYRQLPSGVWVIEQACHWYELKIEAWDVSAPRSEAQASLVEHGELRTFWGWNRAKHALLEAAILISRAHMMQPTELRWQLQALQTPIEKTAGERERIAWALIVQRFL